MLVPHFKALAESHPDAHPALAVTSSALIHQPFAPVYSLSITKVAQASQFKLLAADNESVVYMVLVIVGGQLKEEMNNP